MSVLNKMLRDLEQRQPQSASATHSAQLAYRPERPLWLRLLLLLSFGLLCFAVYGILTRGETLNKPRDSAARVSLAPAAIPAAANNSDVIAAAADDSINAPAIAQTLTPAAVAVIVADTVPLLSEASDSRVNNADTAAEPPTAAVATMPAPPVEDKPVATTAKATPAAGKMTIERPVEPLAQRKAALRQQALGAAQDGQLQQALQYWQQLQQLAPQDAELYLAQAGLWLQLGQPAQAHAVLQLAVAQGIVHADIQLMLAQHAAAAQQWQAVDALLPPQFALAQQPDYYGMKATALQQLGQHQAALHWFSQLLLLQPQQGRWWLGAAISYDALAERAQSQHHYRQALQRSEILSVASRNYIQQRLAATE